MSRIFRFPFFSRRQIRKDVDAELRFHFDARIDELRRLGHGPEEARARAEAEFGDPDHVRAELRAIDERIGRHRDRKERLAGLGQDLAYAVRSLRRSPGLTIGVIVTLALGLGVNAAMFTFLDTIFLRPPAGVERPQEVRRLWTEIQFTTGTRFWSGYSYPQYAAVRSALGDRVPSAVYWTPAKVRVGNSDPVPEAWMSRVSAPYFDLLGVRPWAGRFFTSDEDQLGAPVRVAVMSHDFARRHYGGSAAVGRAITIGRTPYTIIGVAPPGFTGTDLDAAELWLPLPTMPSAAGWWREHRVNGLQVLLRLPSGMADGAVEERAVQGLTSPEARWRPSDTSSVARLGSIIRARGPGDKKQEVHIATRLAGVTGIVFLIACANVINLLLARAVRRRREIAVRLALGVSRARLTRLLSVETLLLSLAAGLAAIVAAYWGGALLRGLLLPEVNWGASPLDARVVGLALLIAIGAGLIVAVLPVRQALGTDISSALKAGVSRDAARPSRLRSGLVVVQAALSVVLLIGAGLFLHSLQLVRDARIGFDTPRIVFGGSLRFDLPDSARDARTPALLSELAERLRQAPGVEQTALVRNRTREGISFLDYYPDVDTTVVPRFFPTFNAVSAGYFQTVGQRIVRGEGFPTVPPGAMPPVVVVNEAMATAQWPGMEPIGRCIRFQPGGECRRVIGVVETALQDRLFETPRAEFFLPLENMPVAGWEPEWIVARARPGATAAVAEEMQRAIREAVPGARFSVITMVQVLEPEYRPWKLGATLFGAFGVLALIVAAVGTYSTMAYTVAQRTREFGIRSALGAGTRRIVQDVLGQSLRMVAIGVGVGIALALASGRFIATLLYGVEPTDPGVIIATALVLIVVGTIAAIGPAARAARSDPATALRSD